MTKEEIKSLYSMRDILQKYGIEPNRAGFVPCLFHQGDNDASMKIYEKDFHCFGCGTNGDIFTFVQKMDDLSFREAFISLGGGYEKPSFASNLAIYRAKKRRAMELMQQEKKRSEKALNVLLITVYRRWEGRCEPFSDEWCDCQNALQHQLNLHEQLNEPR